MWWSHSCNSVTTSDIMKTILFLPFCLFLGIFSNLAECQPAQARNENDKLNMDAFENDIESNIPKVKLKEVVINTLGRGGWGKHKF